MEKNEELKRIGYKIRLAREAKKLSQTDLAYSIGKDQPSINRIEKGNINPSYLFLLEICKGLEIKLSDLLNS